MTQPLALRMGRAARAAALLLVGTASSWQLAAQGSGPMLAPSAVLECMTPAPAIRGLPEYPVMALKSSSAGQVTVDLRFDGANTPPHVTVVSSEGITHVVDEFVDAVRAHVRDFRVPCAETAPTAPTVRMSFHFKPAERRVFSDAPSDLHRERRRKLLTCMTPDGRHSPPYYSPSARRDGVQGRVFAKLRFTGADKPPDAQLHATADARVLEASVREWLKDLRMPCHDGDPLESTIRFVFRLERDSFGFKPITFRQLLASIKDLDRQALNMDTARMSCPFDVSLTYLQPMLPNIVSQVGSYDAARQPLLDWLKRITLNLTDKQLNAVYADDLELTIPCVQIDLKPKE